MPVFIEKKHTSSLFSANNNIAVWIIGYRAEIFAEQVDVRGFAVCFMFPLNPTGRTLSYFILASNGICI